MKKILLVALAVVLAGTAPLALARHSLGTMAGTVLNANGAPVAGARVTMEMADGRHPHATTTDSHGRFYFAQYASGLYNLRAYHKGEWSDWLNNIQIKTGKQTNVTLRLHAGASK